MECVMNSKDNDADVEIVLVEQEPKPTSTGTYKSKSLKTFGFGSAARPLKKSKPGSLSSWVSSSFDGFDLPKATFNSTPLPKAKACAADGRNKNVKESTTTTASIYSNFESRKRPRESVQTIPESSQGNKSPVASSSEVWSQKYAPQNKGELAVHKKKVEDIEDWLQSKASHVIKRRAPILLLTGPPGAGKTACIKLLCAEHGYTLQEWSSTSELTADQWDSQSDHSSERSKVDVYTSQSQSSVFQNFLLRANKYQALDILGSQTANSLSCHGNNRGRSLILIEDLPNVFFRDTALFHEILRKYHSNGHSPIVFVMTESSSNSSSTQKLFPRDLQSQLGMVNISVNPVAPTMLTKVLSRAVTQEARKNKFTPPSPSVIESIAMSCGGDIRAAFNTLQFACRRDTSDIAALDVRALKNEMKRSNSSSKSKSKGQRHSKNNTSDISSTLGLGAKDTSVFLFHAVGKILYFKRGDPADFPDAPKLPDHLQEHYRDPLLVNPEEVVAKSHLNGEYFTTYLHENYVEFLPEVEDLVRASEYFSDSDHIAGGTWNAREDLQKYSVSIASRGFIHSNSEQIIHTDKRTNQGWRPLHKSQWFSACKKASENVVAARQLFKGYHWEPEVLCTEMLPYISLTNPTLHDPGQISFVQEMTQFPKHRFMFRSNLETLDEKDVVKEDEESSAEGISASDMTLGEGQDEADDNLPASQSNVKVIQDDEEEVEIEEFDD